MNSRVLELLQNPEMISVEDTEILKKEISIHPYMQSLHFLNLLCTHRFSPENYTNELSKTAAHTTDKKILYHLIYGRAEKKVEEKFLENREENMLNEVGFDENLSENKNIETVLESQDVGEKTNIEVSSEEKNQEIISEAEITKIDEDTQEKEEKPFQTREEDLNYTKDKVLEFNDNNYIEEVKASDISFSGIDSFLPNITFKVPTKTVEITEAENTQIQNHQIQENSLENLNLIPTIPIQEEKTEEISDNKGEISDTKIEKSFSKSPAENVHESTEKIILEQQSDAETNIAVIEREIIEETVDETPVQEYQWKPLNFTPNPLDSQIHIEKRKDVPTFKAEESVVQPQKIVEEEKIKVEKPEEKLPEKENYKNIEPVEIQQDQQEISNIPTFINTWQNWLKIERKPEEIIPKNEELKEENPEDKKSHIIEKFIETNPKISQLKEDIQFTVKEKQDDISHLMTETLAKLYVEQRLYSKAIKAYEVLMNKFPEKKNVFQEKIEEIKSLKK